MSNVLGTLQEKSTSIMTKDRLGCFIESKSKEKESEILTKTPRDYRGVL